MEASKSRFSSSDMPSGAKWHLKEPVRFFASQVPEARNSIFKLPSPHPHLPPPLVSPLTLVEATGAFSGSEVPFGT